MKIAVKRFQFLEACTIGRLSIDGEDQQIFTLEGKYREVDGQSVDAWKVPGHTAIPRGTYQVTIEPSAHFGDHYGTDLPLLSNVPGFDGVRIHPGNTDVDTEGCILVGLTWNGGDYIGQSRDAFHQLLEKIRVANSVSIELS